MGTLLVVTAAYGALLALLRAVGCHRAVVAWIVIFVSFVGTAQMLLFGSRRPREASLLAGGVGLPVVAILVLAIHSAGAPEGELVCLLVAAVVFGVPTGYLAGCVVAGVFLMMDAIQQLLSRLSNADGAK